MCVQVHTYILFYFKYMCVQDCMNVCACTCVGMCISTPSHFSAGYYPAKWLHTMFMCVLREVCLNLGMIVPVSLVCACVRARVCVRCVCVDLVCGSGVWFWCVCLVCVSGVRVWCACVPFSAVPRTVNMLSTLHTHVCVVQHIMHVCAAAPPTIAVCLHDTLEGIPE